MLPCSLRKVRGLSVDAVSCQVGPRAEEKNSPFDFSAKKNEYWHFNAARTANEACGHTMLQRQFNLFNSKHGGKVYHESEIIKENLSSILKIFTIEPSHGKF
jgi:hypothetical protein